MSSSRLVGTEPTPHYTPELAALLGFGGEANDDISLLEIFLVQNQVIVTFKYMKSDKISTGWRDTSYFLKKSKCTQV